MFKLLDQPVFDWNVDISVPVGPDAEGENRTATQRFVATFEVLPVEAVQSPDRDIGELMARAWIGWREIEGPDGTPLPFSPEARARMLGIAYVRLGVWSAYLQGLSGDAARKGN